MLRFNRVRPSGASRAIRLALALLMALAVLAAVPGVASATSHTGSIGDFVWEDLYEPGVGFNHVQDPGELGVPGVTVNLLSCDPAGDPIAVTGVSVFDADSEELVGESAPATNAVDGNASTFWHTQWFGSPDPAHPHWIILDLGSSREVEQLSYTPRQSSANGRVAGYNVYVTDDPTSWGSAVATGTFPNSAAVQQVVLGAPAAGQYVVFEATSEVNGNPWTSVAELAIFESANDNVIATTTTDANGLYLFDGLEPGCYRVEFVKSSIPAGFEFVPDDGPDETTDSDANPETGVTAEIQLNEAEDNRDVDAGICNARFKSALGDFVWEDLNANGIQDVGEPGVPGVTVNLYREQEDGSLALVDTTVTDAAGEYRFEPLQAGTYEVQFIAPPGTSFTFPNAGANDALDSDASPTTGRTGPIFLPPVTEDITWDAGLVTEPELASLGDFVFEDTNGNGIQDPGEPGVPGVTVNLLSCDPVGVPTLVTGVSVFDADSEELVGELAPATNAVDGNSSTFWHTQWFGSPDPAHPHWIVLDLGSSRDVAQLDYTPRQSSANGRVAGYNVYVTDDPTSWGAAVASGTFPNSPAMQQVVLGAPVAGRYVVLEATSEVNGNPWTSVAELAVYESAGGGVIATTTTDANGFYQFTGLEPGCYRVEFELPDGFEFSPPNQGADDTVDSDADPATGQTGDIILDPGENDPTNDAGLVPAVELASLGDFVWRDLNRNGTQDPGEPGVPGIDVTLLDCNDNVIASTTTNADGFYAFTDLEPGCYRVVFEANGFEFTTPNVGDDATDSDADPATGRTGDVNLGPGENDTTVDAGLVSPLASLGDFVWEDLNADGIQDAGEPGIPGVTVNLLACASDPEIAPVSGITVEDVDSEELVGEFAPATNAIDGNASTFWHTQWLGSPDPAHPHWVILDLGSSRDVAAFEYTPRQTSPNGRVAAWRFYVTDNPAAWGAAVASGTFPNSSATQLRTLAAPKSGRYVVFEARSEVNGNPWTSVAELEVFELIGGGPGSVISTTTTDADGFYSFTGLEPGCYRVEFVAPAGFTPSPQDQGADDTVDSDADPVTGQTDDILLAAGQNDPTNDAGFYQPASLGDFVWSDTDGDGIQDAGEPGIPGVTVTLLDCAGNVLATTTTDGTGFYQFTGLTPGCYQVAFETPAGTTPSPANQGGDDTVDSDPVGGVTGPIDLESGENDPTNDAGFVPDEPGIDIEKLTNGNDADGANDADVPQIAPGDPVTWTYIVTNTGNVPFDEADVDVSDDIVGAITNIVDKGDGDNVLSPGEVWVYEATAPSGAEDLENPSPGTVVVDGCNPDGTTVPGDRATYENVGTVTVPGGSDNDPSHYCNPPEPGIDIEKLTNGNQADDANDADVPRITPGATVTWTYVVTNTGDVAFDLAEVIVTDDQGVTPVFDPASDDGDNVLSPGEQWIYTASQTAPLLTFGDPGLGTIVPGCGGPGEGEEGDQATYENIGTVNVPGASDSDPSHFCNDVAPQIDLEKLVLAITSTGDVCDTYGKPVDLTFEYQPGTDVVTGQDAGKASATGTPDDDGSAFIVVSNESDVNKLLSGSDKRLFDGTVNVGETFTASRSFSGVDKFESNSFMLVFEDEASFLAGNAPLQTMQYHTSCSQPIQLGDVIGSLVVVGYVGETGTVPVQTPVDADTPTGPEAAAGSTVEFTYIVTNPGDTSLGNVTLVDDNGTPADPSDDFNPTFVEGDDGDGILQVGETWIYTASTVAVLGQYRNDAVVVGTPVDDQGNVIGGDVTDTDPAHYIGVFPPGDVCETVDKPVTMTFLYQPGTDVVTAQDPGKATATGTPDDDGSAFIIVSDQDDLNKLLNGDDKRFFDGTVNVGDTFDASELFDNQSFGSNTFILVFEDEASFLAGNAPLQTMQYHTSCSQPIQLGDIIGSVQLVGYIGDNGPA